MIQYCTNSSLTSIMTFTYLDICKWRVALVRQDMLTRSGAPDIICLPFGWWIHFALSFLPPFWHFSPYWLGMEVLCRNAWCHIFGGDTFSFYLFIFQCGVFSCLSSSWHGLVIHFARELLAPSWCCACFVSCFLYTCFVVPAREGSAALHVVWMFLLLPILSENGFSLLEIDFVCLTSDSLTTDQYFVETFTCCLFTIKNLTNCSSTPYHKLP